MSDARKKSPRSPSLTLEDAVERAMQMYEKEHRHEVSTDVAAQDIGYKSAKNGAALSALASLRYFGLVDKPRDGVLAVSKDIETYKFAPDENVKRELRQKWLKTPPVFAELLEKYGSALPSDAAIKFELIQRGFMPTGADECVSVFRRSVDFAQYSGRGTSQGDVEIEIPNGHISTSDTKAPMVMPAFVETSSANDRIPVRLTGNRRAWLEIPSPFFEKDKAQLIAQIQLLLADEEEENE